MISSGQCLFKYIRVVLAALFLLSSLTGLQAQYKAIHYFSRDEALKTVFPSASRVSSTIHRLNEQQKSQLEQSLGAQITETQVELMEAFEGNARLGYAIILDEIGKHCPITFITAISPDYTVHNVLVMVYREPFGAAVHKKRFLKQFYRKSSKDPLQLNRDIDGITGATYSTAAMSKGVKKALLIVEQLSKSVGTAQQLRQSQLSDSIVTL